MNLKSGYFGKPQKKWVMLNLKMGISGTTTKE
jgi:hypothetical protein